MAKAQHLAVFEVAPEATNINDPAVYRDDIIGFRNVDARCIAKAGEMFELLERVAETAVGDLRLQAERIIQEICEPCK